MKIIGVGFHKTGLTSLKIALELLGYKTVKGRQAYKRKMSYNQAINYLSTQNYSALLDLLDPYQAVVDNPWNILFREIDERYPDCKFVLTLREEDSWLTSAKNYFGKRPDTLIRKWIYGTSSIEGNEPLFLKRYKDHNEMVFQYFKNRPNDLLIVNWEKGNGWRELCHFLNKPIIKLPFPHFNKGK